MNEVYDVAVIGGGPGGYVAAIRAAQLGMKVALVEKAELGGVCLNWGCIPTKALLRSSSLYRQLSHLEQFGVSASGAAFDLAAMVRRSREVAKKMERGIQGLLRKNGVDVIVGTAKLGELQGEARMIQVAAGQKDPLQLKSAHVILATGARGRTLPELEPDGKLVWGAREAMTPGSLPRNLIVVGAGAIGVEFASFYADLGCNVTILEAAEHILPAEDREISALAQKEFIRRGIKIQTSARISEVHKAGGKGIEVKLEAGREALSADRLIAAVGVVGNTENLGLEKTRVEIEKTFIRTDGFGRTRERGIYAIGDVAGPPCLAHKASHEGVICVEKIAGRMPQPLHPLNIPGCTYSWPQIASVGMTEEAARKKHGEIRVGRFPFLANGKAVAMGETEGMVKTIFNPRTGELLGAHMIGAEVTEMIQGFVLARTGELTEAEIMESVFPHPTMSEVMHESTLAAFEGALHI